MTKKKLLTVILVAVLLLSSVSVIFNSAVIFAENSKSSDGQLLLDSSFESGSFGNGWGIVNDIENNPEIVRGITNSGDYLVMMKGSVAGITQTFNVTEATDYIFSIALAEQYGSAKERKVDIEIFSEDNTLLKQVVYADKYGYETVELNFTALKSEKVNLVISHRYDDTVCIDDVRISATEKKDRAMLAANFVKGNSELIVDGGFDNGIATPWNNLGASVVETTSDFAGEKPLGDKCVKINRRQNGISQEVSLENGRYYELSFLFAPKYNESFVNSIHISVIGNETKEVYYDDNITSSGKAFEKTIIKFLSLNDEKATVKFDRTLLVGTSIYIDDVSLKALPLDIEMLKDGDFESDKFITVSNEGWAVKGTEASLTNKAFSGNVAIQLKPDADTEVYQDGFYLFSGVDYRLRFYHNGCSIGSQIYIVDENNIRIAGPFTAGDDDEWNQYFFDFSVSETKKAKIIIKNLTEMEGEPEEYEGSENAFFDNISLHRTVSSEPDEDKWSGNYDINSEIVPDTNEHLKNGSFEQNSFGENPEEGWSLVSSSAKDKMIFTSAFYAVSNGKYAICVPMGLNEAFYQVVTVKENTNYKLSFDSLADNEGCKILIGDSLENMESIIKYERIVKSDSIVSNSFNFNTAGNKKIYIVIVNRSGSTAWFDNFSLTEIDTRVKNDIAFRGSSSFKVRNTTRTELSISWSSVKSKLYSSDQLLCDLYMSEQPITVSNYSKLTSVYHYSGKDIRRKTFTGLKEGTNYYFAVVASDPKGNTAYMFSSSISTLKGIGKELINPSFETGDQTGWEVSEAELFAFTTMPSEGQYGCALSGWAKRLSQQVKVEPGAKYVLAFDALDNSSLPFTYWMGSNDNNMIIGRVEANSSYTRRIDYFTADTITNQITISFSNQEDYNTSRVDNVYFKKIGNENIYFTSKPTLCISGDGFIIVEWKPVMSTDDSENITYEVFVKDSEFNEGDLSNLIPIKTVKGTKSLTAVVNGLSIEDSCWFAVRATDSKGNQVSEYSYMGYSPRSGTADNKKPSENNNNESGSENFDFEDDFSIDTEMGFDDLDLGNFDDIDTETDFGNATKTARRTLNKKVEETSKMKIILGIVFIVVGGLIIAAGIVLFIILLKKRGSKKTKIIISAIAAVVALILIFVGIYLLLNSTVLSNKKVVETKKIPVNNEIVDSEFDDDDKLSENDLSDNSFSFDDFRSNDKEETKNTEENKPTSKENEDEGDVVPNNVYNGKTYYVSSSMGNDANDGLSQEKPLKTIDKVNSLNLAAGDNVLFKCGDLWRQTELQGKPNVRYASYGEGEKPTFYGSEMNYANPEKWTSTQYPNVYAVSGIVSNIGGLVFNDGECVPNFVNTDSASSLTLNGQFCFDKSLGKCCVYSDKGNPASLYSSIEVINEKRMIYVVTGDTVENIRIKYAAYGVQCWGGNDIVVRNMDISYIGGRSNSSGIRAGNAIEFWQDLDKILIENNKISNCYDTGITAQYAGDSNQDVVMTNITVRHNNVSYCHWSTEFWIKIDGTNLGTGVITKLRIHDNYFGHAGEEWSSHWRPYSSGTGVEIPWHIHMMTFDNYSDLDISIKNNIFDRSTGGIYFFGPSDYLPELSGNTYIQKRNGIFGRIYVKMFSCSADINSLIDVIETNAEFKFAE